MVHVDDVMFCGDGAYWDVFLKGLKQRYSISHSQLGNVDTEIQFLKRTLRRVFNGLAMLPGTSIAKVIHGFEAYFARHVRKQFHVTAPSKQRNAYAFRSVVGTVLYLARDRPDLLFTMKKPSSSMNNPTLTAVAQLRKLVGCLKTTSEFCMMLEMRPGKTENHRKALDS